MNRTAIVTMFASSAALIFGLNAAANAQTECGGPGAAPCPFQAFMRASVAAPLAKDDTDALAAGLEKASKLSPDPTWKSWEKFALDGAAAAKKGDLTNARAACKGCHDAWREPYRAKFRSRLIPR